MPTDGMGSARAIPNTKRAAPERGAPFLLDTSEKFAMFACTVNDMQDFDAISLNTIQDQIFTMPSFANVGSDFRSQWIKQRLIRQVEALRFKLINKCQRAVRVFQSDPMANVEQIGNCRLRHNNIHARCIALNARK